MKRFNCSVVFLAVAAAILESMQGKKTITKRKERQEIFFSDSFTKFSTTRAAIPDYPPQDFRGGLGAGVIRRRA